MGRTEPSAGQPPASFRRDVRAKKAKATINQLIPSLLATHPRARRSIEAAELIVNPSRVQRQEPATDKKHADSTESSGSSASGPRLIIYAADTLTTARSILSRDGGPKHGATHVHNKETKVAILNMASPLSPGGGFLNGASSQEESLCMRTTLLPSLSDDYYRLPELGAVYTPDILVFRDEQSEDVLPKGDRWFVDCITAAMLRGPELDHDDAGKGAYANQKDRELVLQKMRMVLRICQAKGVKKVVLGAWGCGAYGNPVTEVATAWRKVLLPRNDNKGRNKGSRETWDGIEDVVFAIKDAGMADAFQAAFGDGLLRDDVSDNESDEGDEDNPAQTDRQELQARVDELELRIEATDNPQVASGLRLIVSGLIKQLPKDEEPSE
ncbi:hypothetical protein G7046_g6421 [Stylonectria norvegica]|nr:hypothetical protein G7046_g6421 [Stylonectria norvegica]